MTMRMKHQDQRSPQHLVTRLSRLGGRALSLLALIGLSGLTQAQPLPDQSEHKHMGVATCASTICHGAVLENDSMIFCSMSTSPGPGMMPTPSPISCCTTKNQPPLLASWDLRTPTPPRSASTATLTMSHRHSKGQNSKSKTVSAVKPATAAQKNG